MSSCCGASRFWFNQGLALVKERLDRRSVDENVHVPWSYKSLCSEFAPIKDEVCPWRSEVVVGSMQAGLEQLSCALQQFSKGRRNGRPVGFPTFRTKGRCHESVIFQRPRLADHRHVLLDRRLGRLRTKEPMRKLARLLERDEHARVIRSTVQRSNGGWAISFTVQRSPKDRRARRPDAVIGIDLGLARLATLSTGQTAANGRPLQGALRKLRRCHRQLDRQRRAANPANYLADGRAKPGRQSWAMSARMACTHRRLQRAAFAGSEYTARAEPRAHDNAHARVRCYWRGDHRRQESDGEPPSCAPDRRRGLGRHSRATRLQDGVV